MRFSAIVNYLECPQKWYYGWRDRIVSPKLTQPLRIGLILHSVWENWYKRPVHDRSEAVLAELAKGALEKMWLDGAFFDEEEYNKERTMVFTMLKSYFAEFNIDEKIFGETEKLLYGYSDFFGTADGLVEYDGKLWILEHKTGDPDIEALVVNSFQSDWYNCLAHQMGLETAGTIFTVLQRPYSDKTKDVRVERYFMEVTPERMMDALNTAEAVRAKASTWNSYSPIYRHRTKDCNWCDYKQLCYLELAGESSDALKMERFVHNTRADDTISLLLERKRQPTQLGNEVNMRSVDPAVKAEIVPDKPKTEGSAPTQWRMFDEDTSTTDWHKR